MTLLIGDIHIDKRFPFTNNKTLPRWRALQAKTLEHIRHMTNEPAIQLGDVFDKFMVDAEDLLRGSSAVGWCHFTLAGNHDISNNQEKLSAIQCLSQISGTEVVWGDIQVHTLGDVRYIFVPHQYTQKAFEDALERAKLRIDTRSALNNVLLLHCNFGDRPGTNTENYLRAEMAKSLLGQRKYFQAIVSGHEHNASKPMADVYMTGSILPMNFGEMTDKVVTNIDGNILNQIVVWSAKDNYAGLPFAEFMKLPIDTPLQFIQVDGEVNLAESVAVAKRVAEWYQKSETLIAVKNNTTVMKHDGVTGEKVVAQDWVAEVSKELSQTECVLFQELLNGDAE